MKGEEVDPESGAQMNGRRLEVNETWNSGMVNPVTAVYMVVSLMLFPNSDVGVTFLIYL